MVAGGVRGCSRGHAWLLGGVWLLWGGGCAWLLQGGMCGCSGGWCAWFFGGVCVVFSGGMHGFFWGACIGYDEIRSMSGRYASYWNAFLFISVLIVIFD